MKAIVYRFFDARGSLLYVGLTAVGPGRWAQHAIDQPWWPLVERVQVAHYPTVEDAAFAEARAIQTEDPIHNVVHKHLVGPSREPQPRRATGTGSVFQRRDGRWVAQVTSGPRGARAVRVKYRRTRAEAERALFELVYR